MPSTVWKGQLTFGLVSIPIRIYRAARQERVPFKRVYRERAFEREEPAGAEPVQDSGTEPEPVSVAPVRHEFRNRSGEAPLSAPEILKGVEFEKNQFAVFRPEEIRRLNVETSSTMEIIEFVKLEQIDPVYFNASYYAAPDKGADKPYQLLLTAMRHTGYAALAHVAMHGRRQFLTLRPGAHGMVMHTLFFEAEVHAADEFHADTQAVTGPEIKLAETLINHLAATFDPSKFKDERLEKIREAIAQKTPASSAAEPSAPARAAVVDIMDALRRSLEQQKKPATREKAAPKRGRAAG